MNPSWMLENCCESCGPYIPVPLPGRPYMVEGEGLQAQVQPSTGSGWRFEGTDLGTASRLHGEVSLVQRLEAASFGGHAKLPSGQGTLALEPRLAELLPLAQEELRSLPAEELASWHAAGLAEHAAVGAFAKLCLEMLVAGAPPRLVRLATKAQEEEVLHAQICLALGGTGESRLNFPAHTVEIRKDLAAMRTAAIDEGLKGEGHAALRLFERAKANGETALGQLALAMAQDEARHAELAEETLAWIQEETGVAAPKVHVQDGLVSVTT